MLSFFILFLIIYRADQFSTAVSDQSDLIAYSVVGRSSHFFSNDRPVHFPEFSVRVRVFFDVRKTYKPQSLFGAIDLFVKLFGESNEFLVG